MTTTNTRYVDPNAEVGGDGTTNALTGEHCAYKSLAIWEAARQGDLVSGDIIEKVICSSDDAGSTHLADTTACTIDGWTTSATQYILVEAATSHGGQWNTSTYRRVVSMWGGPCLLTREAYTRFVGLQAQVNVLGDTATGNHIFRLEAANVKARNCIALAGTIPDGAGLTGFGTKVASLQGIELENCLAYDLTVGYWASRWNYSATYRNCTAQNCGTGFLVYTGGRDYSSHAVNCGAASCTTGFSASGWGTFTTCSTDTPTFVDADNDDFHLAAGDTTWRGNGTDLSATFTDDIDGETRPTGAGTWDIGCDEYVGGAAAVFYFGDRSGGLQNPFATGLTGGLR